MRLKKGTSLRHRLHYWWNYSRLNFGEFDPWISSCQCCCAKCDPDG